MASAVQNRDSVSFRMAYSEFFSLSPSILLPTLSLMQAKSLFLKFYMSSRNGSEKFTKYIGERHGNDLLKNSSHTAKKTGQNHESFKYSSAKLMRRMASTYNGARFFWAFYRSRSRQFWVGVESSGH